jgi:mono/diheme cytochrome c family protein
MRPDKNEGGLMRLRLVVFAIVAGLIGITVFSFITIPATIPASALSPHTPDLANGKEMFYAGGCPACHATPEQDDRTKLGGGFGLKSPFGTFYVPNISSDRTDGIGAWSEAAFVTAVLKGTSPDGGHYFPAFPYPSYAHMKLGDVRDLFAYLKTLPAVAGKVRDHDLSFPFNIRRNVGGWKLLFFDDAPFKPDPTKSAEWNRGAYLVNGPGHCAECHSPRNILGGIKRGQRFAGAPNPEGKGWIPNITQKGLGDWSDKDVAYLLETGQTPDGDFVGSQMSAVVKNTSQLTPADRSAIAIYIKSLPRVEGPLPPPKTE